MNNMMDSVGRRIFLHNAAALVALSVSSGAQKCSAASATLTSMRCRADSKTSSIVDKLANFVIPEDFEGADDTARINAALATGRRVLIMAGRHYECATLTMAVAGTSLEIQNGASINFVSAEFKGIDVVADGCAIIGQGKLVSPTVFDGVNARRHHAVIWCEGQGGVIEGITLENIPRAGIHLEDATNWRIFNCRLIGNYPYDRYSAKATTGHCGIDYNPPSESAIRECGLIVVGNMIESCVQGIVLANYDAAAAGVGIVVADNCFRNCWDHGVYIELGEGHVITGNSFCDCKFPVVCFGENGIVVGNSLYSKGKDQENYQQGISVRDAGGCLIADNTIYGLGAYISVECVTGELLHGNIIRGNIITRTGPGYASFAIRLGKGARFCDSNIIENNIIQGIDVASSGVLLSMARGNVGSNNIVRHNIVSLSDGVPNILVDSHSQVSIYGNRLMNKANMDEATTVRMMHLVDCVDAEVRDNAFLWNMGGKNVSVRGIETSGLSSGHTFSGNRFFFTSHLLASSATMEHVDRMSELFHNQLVGSVPTKGEFTLMLGAKSVTVANANILEDFTQVSITPLDAEAGRLLCASGYFITVANARFVLTCADGSSAKLNARFAYRLA